MEWWVSVEVSVMAWIAAHGLPIIAVIVLALLVRQFGGVFLDRLIRRIVSRGSTDDDAAERQREDTLIRVSYGILNVAVWVIAVLTVLSEAGIDIAPLLAAAGIAGIAVGFGGQYLIRDLFAGLFIIIENQYRVGDVACLDGTCGLVEDISLRKATLRDLDGTVYHVPHGTVNKVSNMSKDYGRVNLNIRISYDADLDRVIEILNGVGAELAADPVWQSDILKPIAFERVDSFVDSAVEVKVLGDTKPLRQWAVAGEYRKRLLRAFADSSVKIQLPQIIVRQAIRSPQTNFAPERVHSNS